MDDKLYFLSATDAISKIKSNEISITQYTNSIIRRINQINPETFAWSHLNFEQTLEQAKKLDSSLQSGMKIGPLCGMPVGIKDIFNTVDFPTEMGSDIWKEFTPGNDARIVHYLKMADALIMGKTETAEFADFARPYDVRDNPATNIITGCDKRYQSGVVQSIMKRIPMHEPWALHEHRAPNILTPDKTDRDT